MTKACVFCDIVAGRTPAHVVLDDERFVAFLDVRPLFPGHVLLVPKEHHETLWDLPPELHAGLIGRTQALSVGVRDATGARGVFNAMNNIVSQSVPHLHLHLIPRRPKDGLRFFLGPRHPYGSPEESAEVARRIAAALDAEPQGR